ncbi:MAG: bifunctional 23S rRNA (guanine(2069)-N(7))-methyltransferase RlmK/23S rRNA (guanine(2445)-N(2))-methyltransferase RlmL [Methylococcaceae bacterium]|nr:bifunctional 23S rRNA (guanine(2069)-N(7))-methyltransferase RlmK/23S rRNA (guanine(2445)-N(2))-methyltransferase RlmL [Methylococcaceae bacterium]
MNHHSFFATSPLGLELLLAEELRGLGVLDAKEGRAGVSFSADLQAAYRVCLWSRLANRVLLKLASFPSPDPQALYQGIADIDWAEHLRPDASLAVDFSSSRSQISHTQFGAQKVKDAIVDQFRELCGERPSVRLDRPDVRVNVYLDKDLASVGLDLSGESLHKRGYRLEGGVAPLKENLAAAILLRAGWPRLAIETGTLIDPMCGSGTLLIEAAWMAADIAPGLMRDHFGFLGWKNHQAAIWDALITEAETRRELGLNRQFSITGYDLDHRAVHAALDNIDRAGLRGRVQVERKAAAQARPHHPAGLLVVNPPYGERLGDAQTLGALYTELGQTLQTHFQGWKASVFTGNPDLAFKLGIRARRFYKLYNGALECKLFNFEVQPEFFFIPHEDESGLSEEARGARALMRRARSQALRSGSGPGAEMFANRLRKNLKNLGGWARRSGVSCYRLYDADLPEYAVAVDVYQGEQTWLHVQEYEAPASVDPQKAEGRLVEALSMMPKVLEIPPENLYLKIRRRQKGVAQYEKQAQAGKFFVVEEGGCRFWVNFEDYLDTGLFLDHRPTRRMIQDMARDKQFLNLFAYTGSATVHAAVGGAAGTTTVDMSNTYLDWARRNLELNGIKGYRHELIQADCLNWLEEQSAQRERQYDLIFLDPPTFSNSKRMGGAFDIQRDHVDLLAKAASLLKPEGVLIFSTNFRKFKLDLDELDDWEIADISPKTIPKDFERNPRIHYCWTLKARIR